MVAHQSIARLDGLVAGLGATASDLPAGVVALGGGLCLLLLAARHLRLRSERRKRAEVERHLRAAKESYRAIFDAVGDFIYVQDVEDGRFLDVNPALARAYGYPRQELLVRTPTELGDVARMDMEVVYERFRLAAAGHVQKLTWWARRRDGSSLPMDVTLTRGVYFGRPAIFGIGRPSPEPDAAGSSARFHDRTRSGTARPAVSTGPVRPTPHEPDGSRAEVPLGTDAGDGIAPAAGAASGRPLSVLLVEDEDGVRGLVQRLLQRDGHHVLVAPDGDAALTIARSIEGRLDLLVTDVVMPGLGGAELADRLQERYPELPVLFMSGYTANAHLRDDGSPRRAFLEKPFTPAGFLRAVRLAVEPGHHAATDEEPARLSPSNA